MSEKEKTNPFSWLPEPGEAKAIPGGFIYCDEWEVCVSDGEATGTVTFRFHITEQFYLAARDECPALEANRELENLRP